MTSNKDDLLVHRTAVGRDGTKDKRRKSTKAQKRSAEGQPSFSPWDLLLKDRAAAKSHRGQKDSLTLWEKVNFSPLEFCRKSAGLPHYLPRFRQITDL